MTLGAAVGFALRLREPSPLWARVWLLLAGLCLLLTLVSFVLFVRVFFQTQGRYFYPRCCRLASSGRSAGSDWCLNATDRRRCWG